MREAEMGQIAGWIGRVRDEIPAFQLPDDRDGRQQTLRQLRTTVKSNTRLGSIREDVRALCRRFPVPGVT
jgi:hypothetical protein